MVVGLNRGLTDNGSRRPPGHVTLEGASLEDVTAGGQAVRASQVVVEGSELNTLLGISEGVPEPRVVVRITRTMATHHIVNLGSPDGTLKGGSKGLAAGIGSDGSSGGSTALIHKEVGQQVGLVIRGQDTSVGEVDDGAGGLGGVPQAEVVNKTIEALADSGVTVSAAKSTNIDRVGQGVVSGGSSAVMVDDTIAVGVNDNHNSVPLTVGIVGDGVGDDGSVGTREDIAG